jgi:hypothetical protein
MRSNAGMANRQGDVDLRLAQVSAPVNTLAWLGLTPVILHRPAYEDGTDRGFRNVGYQQSDAVKTPKRKHIRYKTRRKLKIKNECT